FRSQKDVPVPVPIAGSPAGNGSEVRVPIPSANSDRTSTIDGLRTLSLAQLIDLEIACGEANLRRTHKNWADVVELIAVNGLDKSFARRLHPSVRNAFKQLVDRARS
ncbi:MAG: hypothetical protein KDA80_10930, partial [Planctomycetaceae bacterium]|nr:hypothetical protein [Planctomycetaceae bacterium]